MIEVLIAATVGIFAGGGATTVYIRQAQAKSKNNIEKDLAAAERHRTPLVAVRLPVGGDGRSGQVRPPAKL